MNVLQPYPPINEVILPGFCACACGGRTKMNEQGVPNRFINGHNLGSTRPITERLREGVDTSAGPDGCWPWTGAKVKKTGYGRIGYLSQVLGAHQVAWSISTGQPIPTGRVGAGRLLIMHTCDNPICCNPRHLKLGTALDNVRDMLQKGRGRSFGRKQHAT